MAEEQEEFQQLVVGAIRLAKGVYPVDEVFPPTPAKARREGVLILDAVEQLIGAAHVHYRRIQGAAMHINNLQEVAESEAVRLINRANHVSIVADIGALIGTIQRLRGLVKRLPGGASIRLTKRAFEASVREVQEPRHHLEHLDSALKEISETGQGAFGAVSWWYRTGEKDVKCTFFMPGTVAVGKGLGVTRVPRQISDEIDHIWTSIAGSEMNVTSAFRAVQELEGRLRKWGVEQAAKEWPSLAK